MSVQGSTTLSLFTLMKDVSEALNFDRLDRHEDAYRKYLQCTLRVSSGLLKQLHASEGHVFVSDEQQKMVKLGQQCMDRVAKLVNEKLEKVPKIATTVPSSLSLSTEGSGSRTYPRSTPTTPTSRETTCLTPQITSPEYNTVISSLNTVSSSLSEQSTTSSVDSADSVHSQKSTSSRKLGPMEIAARQNQQLLCAFKKRQAQAKTRNMSTNLGLTLQRKMAENLAIAKAQEQVLAKKMKERQKRLEEQAVRRFHTPMGLSEDELRQRQIYKKVLEFEQENIWLIELRMRFENSPTDINIICELIVAVLRCDSHPLTQELHNYQCKLKDQITSLVHTKKTHIDNVKVPISKQLLDVANLTAYRKSFHHSESGLKLSQSDVLLDAVFEDDDSESNDKIEVTKPVEDEKCVENTSESERIGERNCKESKWFKPADMADVTVNMQRDIKLALDEGAKITSKMEEENKSVRNLTRQITEDYERYNQENLDDLFDDSDDCDDDDNGDGNDNNVDDEDNKTAANDDKFDDNHADDDSIAMTDDRNKKADDVSNTLDDNEVVGKNDNDGSEIVQDSIDNVAEVGKSTYEENKNDNIDESSKDVDKVNEEDTLDDTTPKTEEVVMKRKPSYENLDSQIHLLKNEAYHRHLNGITDDILTSIEKVQVLFVIMYEQLDSAEGRDQCNVLLEEYFFRPLWNDLLTLFRLANEPKEVSLAYIMTMTRDNKPESFGVRDKLCLHGNDRSTDQPYQSAVIELLSICQCQTMLGKLDCLVKSSKQVMHCIEHYFKAKNLDVPGIGADDLIPILCYIISRTCLPQLVSECHAMDRFVHEGYILGEEGYCLTSFQTAINFMISEGIALQKP
ncbi:VPS9 domain-containing protein 1 [Mactra antiquata]